jgi:drug/metabolite transporter (DMT)-like permease
LTPANRALPWIALVTVYLFWGSTYLGIRVAVGTIPPYLMTGIRWVVAGALLAAWQWIAAKEKPPAPTRQELLHIAVTAVLLLAIGNGLLCVAELRLESGTSALLIASTPIWMLLIDALRLRALPKLSAVGGVALGSAGIAALVGKGVGHADPLFASIILLASISWAVGSIYARERSHHPLAASLEMLVGGALCIVVGLIAGEASQLNVRAISIASLWGMLWLITGGAMVGYSAYAYAVRTLPKAIVVTYAYVTPVVAVILGALVLHEQITWNVLAGGAAIVASVVLILIGSREAPEEAVA